MRKFLIVIVLISSLFMANLNVEALEDLRSPIKANSAKEPLIEYTLNFIELDSKVLNNIEASLKTTDSDKTKDQEWKIMTSDTVLKAVKDNSAVEITGGLDIERAKVRYNSSLTTLGKNPVAVRLKEKIIKADEENDYEQENVFLEIKLKPNRIRLNDYQVLTEGTLKYKGKSGVIIEEEFNNWIGESAKAPVAILANEIQSDTTKHKEYFAVYVTTKVISQKDLSKKSPLLSMGNIKGMNKLFSRETKVNKPYKRMGVYFSDQGGRLKYKEWMPNGNLACADLNYYDGEFRYKAGIDFSMNQSGLFLASHIKNKGIGESDPHLYLGIADQVTWKNNIDFKVHYLPIIYSKSNIETSLSYIETVVKLRQPSWNIWYKNINMESNKSAEASITYRVSSNLDMQILWEEIEEDERIYLGFIF